MPRQKDTEKLDSPEACAAFRSRYYDSAFKAAISITGSGTSAKVLTAQLFDDMERRFNNVSLPDAVELYILAQINLLYARMGPDLVRRRPELEPMETVPESMSHAAAVSPTPAPAPSQPSQPEKLEKSEEPPQSAAEERAPEQQMPEPAKVEDKKPGEVFNPALTELWTPGMESCEQEAKPQTPQTAQLEAVEEQTEEENQRSIPLTITNTVLFITSVASAIFLLWEMGAFSWLA